eukprot:COSAG05_NODE_4716_length_1399_cov_8.837784_1_plen_331_part_00
MLLLLLERGGPTLRREKTGAMRPTAAVAVVLFLLSPGQRKSAAAVFNPHPLTSAACIEVLAAKEGWNGSQERPECRSSPATCPLITVKGTPGHFKASATGAWQNQPISLGVYGKMDFDYHPELTGTIKCPPDGRAEIHWEQIAPGYWKHHSSAHADACMRCLNNTTLWGGPFLAGVFVLALAYLGVGVAYNIQVRGEKLGLGSLPHRALWLEVAALVKDGVAFARNGGGGSFSRKAVSGDGGTKSTGKPKDGKLEKHEGTQRSSKKKHKKDNYDGSSRSSRNNINGAGNGGNGGGGEPLLLKPDGATSASAVMAKGTVAAGGGRWIHVAQ